LKILIQEIGEFAVRMGREVQTHQEREEERGKGLPEVSNTIPVMRKAVSALRMTLKALAQSTSWVSVI